jgi:hypothetical protein
VSYFMLHRTKPGFTSACANICQLVQHTVGMINYLHFIIQHFQCLSRYICKTQIDVQSSNPHPISTSETFVPHIYVFVCKYSIRLSIVKSMAISHLFKSTSKDLSDVWPIVILTLMLTNKSATYLRIWKGHRFVNTFKSNRDLTSCRFEE